MRRLAICNLLASFALCLLAGSGLAQESRAGALPHGWDPSERLQKGDLAGLTRLRFLTALDFPPFNYLDANDKLSGFNIDLSRAICNELGIVSVCQIQALPWEELPPALKSGQGEAIVAGLGADAQTRSTMAFTRAYMLPSARFMKLRNKPLETPLGSGMTGISVGVVAGSSHEKMLRAFFPNATIVSLPNDEAVYGQLTEGKVEAVFGDGMTFSFWQQSDAAKDCCAFFGGPYYSSRFLGAGMSIATKSDDIELQRSLDFALKALRDKGTLDELYLKYFPVGFH
jgi:polar amino acid transport system substrate-binding protein